MTNLPPPDPRSSRLGFDELVGVVVAFAAIGTILALSLRQKDRWFSVENLVPSLRTTPASPDATASPTPIELFPLETPEPSPVSEASPQELTTPETPVSPTTPVTPKQESRVTPVVVGAPVAKSPTPDKTLRFSDVPPDYWARPYIAALTGKNIIAGFTDRTFRPDAPVTRAEFAAALNRAFGEKVATGVPAYTRNYNDVPEQFWASSAIREATRKGFLQGYPGDVFRPTQEISKLQALLALNSGLDLPAPAAPDRVLQVYQDVAQIPNYAANAVAAATQAGIVVNYPNRQLLEPNILLTRAEAAALIHQALAKAGKVETIPSEYVVQPNATPGN